MDNHAFSSLTNEELRIALELANITSGAASSTLAMLVDQNLEMGQPQIVEFATVEDFAASLPSQSVLSVLRFLNGFHSPVGYILEMPAAVALANVMMGGSSGGSGSISDIELSAVGEAISQMMGAAANSISQFLSHQVDISAPEVVAFSHEKLLEMMPEVVNNPVVAVKYKLTGSSAIPPCELIQLLPLEGFREQVDIVREIIPGEAPMSQGFGDLRGAFLEEDTQSSSAFQPMEEAAMAGVGWGSGAGSADAAFADIAAASMQPPAGAPAETIDFGSLTQSGGYAPSASSPPPQPQTRQTPPNPVTVQPVEFPSFDSHVSSYGGINKNLELVMDVCLNLTVELGRTELPIKEVLELTRGSVIELNRVAGESVDLFANGKMIAKGEVVVIEDNFGLRITSIVSPADRIRGL
jgi:flagellar motor switch protein FliN